MPHRHTHTLPQPDRQTDRYTHRHFHAGVRIPHRVPFQQNWKWPNRKKCSLMKFILRTANASAFQANSILYGCWINSLQNTSGLPGVWRWRWIRVYVCAETQVSLHQLKAKLSFPLIAFWNLCYLFRFIHLLWEPMDQLVDCLVDMPKTSFSSPLLQVDGNLRVCKKRHTRRTNTSGWAGANWKVGKCGANRWAGWWIGMRGGTRSRECR